MPSSQSNPRSFIGTQLRRARREKKMSQEELAEKLGVHRTTLIRWESDMGHPPPEQQELLAELLERPLDWFFQGDPDPMSVAWITDPWLRRTPLARLQALTPGALKSLGMTAFKLSQVTRLTSPRLEEIMAGSLASAQEIQQLRDHLGDRFNPTPTLARHTSPPPNREGVEASSTELSVEEKLDLILSRLNRLEKRQIQMEEMLAEILSRQT